MSEIASQVVGSNQPVADTQADSIGSFSFDNLHAQALSKFEGTPAAPEQAAPLAQEPVEQIAQPATNVDTASEAKLAQLADDQLVEVTVDGEKVTMPWAEARGGVMRQAKFTKEMQSLRTQQQQLQQNQSAYETAQQERDALVQVLNNKELVAQLIAQKYPDLLAAAGAAAEQQVAQLDPNDIASVGQVQEIAQQYAQNVQQLVQQVQQQLAQQVEQVTQTIEERQATAKLAGEINTTIGSLFETHPYIKSVIPEAEQMLRYQVAMMKPQTPQEAVEAFKTVFGGWVENYNKTVAETNKGAVVAKQKLTQNNIQPPGGAQVQPSPANFKTTNPHTGKVDVDWAKLREVAAGMIGNR